MLPWIPGTGGPVTAGVQPCSFRFSNAFNWAGLAFPG